MKLRWVTVWEWPGIENNILGRGVFQQYGCDYKEFDAGPGNYTTAIIEMEGGNVMNVPVNQIIFDEPLEALK